MKLLYSIKTLAGRRVDVEAESAGDALRVAGIARKDCRKWYPFPVRVISPPITEETKAQLRELSLARAMLCSQCGKPTWAKGCLCRKCKALTRNGG